MSNFTALEVVIGLAFVYFVLALICSAVAEALSSLQRKRPKMLVEGIANLLSGSDVITAEGKALAELFWKHPLVEGLTRPIGSASAGDLGKTGKGPAYIPAHTFMSVILDLGARATQEAAAAPTDESRNSLVISTKLVDAINALPSAPLRQALLAIYKDVDWDAAAFRRGAEQWYDDAMDRVSGWYKRHIQVVLWIIAIIVVLFLNVDTFQIATTLWKDPTARAALVARADTAVQQGQGSVDLRRTVNSIELPLGWKFKFGRKAQEIPNRPLGIIAKLIGLLLTAAALSLGAPFWFDLLSKFVRVRGSGPVPAPTASSP